MLTKDNVLEKLKELINVDYFVKAVISNPIKKVKICLKK